MHAEIRHDGKFTFTSTIRDHKFQMDTQVAAGGDNKGPSPKEMLIASVIGCTGMDIVSLLKKHKMTTDSLVITGDAEPRGEHPRIFSSFEIVFTATGTYVGAAELVDAAKQSLTKYCGVTAMISKTVPVQYRVILNGNEVGTGKADFN